MPADVWPAAAAPLLAPCDGVIVGGALYNNRWHRDAQRFVKRQGRELGALPVWLFSSGLLGDAESWDAAGSLGRASRHEFRACRA